MISDVDRLPSSSSSEGASADVERSTIESGSLSRWASQSNDASAVAFAPSGVEAVVVTVMAGPSLKAVISSMSAPVACSIWRVASGDKTSDVKKLAFCAIPCASTAGAALNESAPAGATTIFTVAMYRGSIRGCRPPLDTSKVRNSTTQVNSTAPMARKRFWRRSA